MNIDDLTVEQVKEMSAEEVIMWFTEVQKANQVEQARKALLNLLEVRDASENSRTIKFVNSKVVD